MAFTNGPSMVQYWGQNSAGATGDGSQQSLGSYCNTDATDVIVMAFINTFNIGSLPNMDLSNACKGSYFPGTQLLYCPEVANDIKACQAKGKKVLISLGGAAGSYGFQNDNDAVTFANTLWNLFGNGKSNTRPFGDAVLDGFDLDIEGGGSTGYVTLVKTLRSLYATDSSKQYYVTAAPQCPFPDAILGSVINGALFDAVLVQFYNNYCSCGGTFNFDTWDNWAKGTSPNKNVKVFLGLPGSPQAAGSGYQSMDQLQPILSKISQYSSFGGVSIWDASQSYDNDQVSPNFAEALAKVVHGLPGGGGGDSTSTTTSKTNDCPVASPGNTLVSTPSSATSCSNGETSACINGQFALCDHGDWNKISCPVGTGCLSNADTASKSAYCGFNTFDLGINARRMNTRPFGSTVTVQMTVQPNTTITSVKGGAVNQNGRQVTLTVRNQQQKIMALTLQVTGETNSDILLAPDPRTLQFTS
ncbi:glycoside hydrolase superfamily [Phascolomyces articulosus]|uniref:chitinase n=1 Tax=Phascolomyces articulosus TaxID=60185 RepID=A0AAD5PJ71_9FUNG|nr:glycoside hydrolase superfamily [Phascolomyces articulosus]